MTLGHLDSDRLIALLHERQDLTAEERLHLVACAECRLELELVRASGRLEHGAVARLDSGRIADAVRRRLATSGPRVRPMLFRWIAVAAAAALLLVVYHPGGSVTDPMPGPPRAAMLHELDGLTEAELEAVLDALPPAADRGGHVESAPLDQLDTRSLERVLQSISME
jgi:hypothetical protein